MFDAQVYMERLLYEFRPFLNWVYSGGRQGVNSKRNSEKIYSKNFNEFKDMDKVLQKYIKHIRMSYTSNGRPRGVSRKIQDDYSFIMNKKDRKNLLEQFLKNQEVEVKYRKYLTPRFHDDLAKKINQQSRTNGSRCHDFVTQGYIQPGSIGKVAKNGDKYVKDDSGILIASEVYHKDVSGSGRADFIVFKKLEVEGYRRRTMAWVPIIVLDLKTKSAFNWDFRGKLTKSQEEGQNGPHLLIEQRDLTEEEWRSAEDHAITPEIRDQLNTYSRKVLFNFFQSINFPLGNHFDILTGVITADTADDWSLLRKEIKSLIVSVVEEITLLDEADLKDELITNKPIFSLENSETKLSLQFDLSNLRMKKLSNVTETPIQPEKVDMYYPEMASRTKDFILYLTAEGAVSSGHAAAWIAGFHQLIPYVTKKHENENIVLLDLIGDLKDFLNQRIRLNPLLYRHLSQVKIHSIDHQSLDLTVFPFTKSIQTLDDSQVVVVSGWGEMQKLIKSYDRNKYEQYIIKKLGKNKTIYWIDYPHRDIRTSKIYQQHTLLPYPSEVLPVGRSQYVSKIMWNLPTKPRTLRQKTPQYDELRVIRLHDKKNILLEELAFIRPLIRFSARFHQNEHQFRNLNYFEQDRTRRIRYSDTLQTVLIDVSYQLTPWLARLGGKEYKEKPLNEFLGSIDSRIMTSSPNIIRYSYNRYLHQKRKPSEKSLPKSAINTKYRSRGTRKLKTKPDESCYDPPNPSFLKFNLDLEKANETERKRIEEVIQMIYQEESTIVNENLVLFKDLLEIVSSSDKNFTNQIIGRVRKWEDDTGKSLWSMLFPARKFAYDKYIKPYNTFKKRRKNSSISILEEFGNGYFLFLLHFKEQYPQMQDTTVVSFWNELLPWILKDIGFNDNYPTDSKESVFDLARIWRRLHAKVRYFVNTEQVQYKELVNTRHGFISLYDKFNCIILENEENNLKPFVGLFSTKKDSIIPPVPYWYNHDASNLRFFNDNLNDHKLYPILNGFVNDKECMWYFENKTWNLLGQVRLFYKPNESTNLISIKVNHSSLSFIPEYIEPIKPDRDFLETVLESMIFTTPIKVSVNVTLDREDQKIIADFIALDKEAIANYEDKKIATKKYFASNDLITDLESGLENNYLKIIDKEENEISVHWDRYNGVIFSEELATLKLYLRRDTDQIDLPEIEHPPDAEIATLIEDEVENIYPTCTISHNSNLCPVSGFEFDEVVKYQKKLMSEMTNEEKKEARKMYYYYHGDCWNIDLGNSELQEELLGYDKTHGVSSKTVEAIYDLGRIHDEFEQKMYIVDIEFEGIEDGEILVYQEDLTMLWILRKIYRDFSLTQIDVNSHLQEDMGSTAMNFSLGHNEFLLHYIIRASGQHTYNSFFGGSSLCKSYKHYEAKMDAYLGLSGSNPSIPFENQDEIIEEYLNEWKNGKFKAHFDSCDFCISDQDTDTNIPIFLSLYFEEVNGKIKLVLKTEERGSKSAEYRYYTIGEETNYINFLDYVDSRISLYLDPLDDLIFPVTNSLDVMREEEGYVNQRILDNLGDMLDDIVESIDNKYTVKTFECIKKNTNLVAQHSDYDPDPETTEDMFFMSSERQFQELCKLGHKMLQLGQYNDSLNVLAIAEKVYLNQLSEPQKGAFSTERALNYVNPIELKKQKVDLPYDLATLRHYQGINKWYLAEFREARAYFKKSLALRMKYGHKEEVAISYSDYGSMHYHNREYSTALNYLTKSLKLSRSLNANWLICPNLQNLSRVFIRLDNLGSAMKLAEEAYRLAQEMGNQTEIAYTNEILAKIYLSKNELTKAKILFEANLILWEKSEDEVNKLLAISNTHYNLVLISYELNQPKNAIKSLKELAELSLKSDLDLIQIRYKLAMVKSLINDDFVKNFVKSKSMLNTIIDEYNAQPNLKLFAFLTLMELMLHDVRFQENSTFVDELKNIISKLLYYAYDLNFRDLSLKIEYLQFLFMVYNRDKGSIDQQKSILQMAKQYSMDQLDIAYLKKLYKYKNFETQSKSEIIAEALQIVSSELKLQTFIE
jgi:hypothetical protein